MKSIIAFIFISFLIVIITLSLTGCATYTGSMDITPTGVKVESNKPMAITKTIDKDGAVTYTYSSKKDSGWFGNLLTLVGLRTINK